MSYRFRTRLWILLLLGMIVCNGTYCMAADEIDSKELLRQAEILLQFSIDTPGSATVRRHALELLEEAEKGDHAAVAGEIQRLRKRIDYEQKRAGETFYDYFPLAQFVRKTIFVESGQAQLFTVWDDPKSIAASEALEKLIESLKVPQCDVILSIEPHDPELEWEFLSQLDRMPKFSAVRLGRQLVANIFDTYLPLDADLPELSPLQFTKQLPAALFNDRPLLLIRVHNLQETRGYFHSVVEGHLFPTLGKPASQSLRHHGYAVDRLNMWWPIIAVHLLLLAAAPLVCRELVKLTSHIRRPDWSNAWAIGVLGFIWGRGMVLALAPLLAWNEPPADALVAAAFWWPAQVGVAVFLGPAVVAWYAEHRFNALGSAIALYKRWGAIFAVVALGGSAYMIQAALHYDGWDAWGMMVPLLVSGPLAAFIVGRALDKSDVVPLWGGAAATVVTLWMGFAWGHASTLQLWFCLFVMVGVATVSLRPEWLRRHDTSRDERADTLTKEQKTNPPLDRTLDDLIKKAYEPPFHQTETFDKAYQKLKEAWDCNKTVHLGLYGPAGIGKSATLSALQPPLREHFSHDLLMGTCLESQADAAQAPYQVFRQAIADYFHIDPLGPHAGDVLESFIDNAVASVFPLFGLLPQTDTEPSGSKRDMFAAIAKIMRDSAQEKPALLVLDDVQWIDAASKELLEFLIEQFPAGGDCQLAILIAGREKSDVQIVHTEKNPVLPVEPLRRGEMQKLLTDTLRIKKETVNKLFDDLVEKETSFELTKQSLKNLKNDEHLIKLVGNLQNAPNRISTARTELVQKVKERTPNPLEHLNSSQHWQNLKNNAHVTNLVGNLQNVPNRISTARTELVRKSESLKLVIKNLEYLENKKFFTESEFLEAVQGAIDEEELFGHYKDQILQYATKDNRNLHWLFQVIVDLAKQNVLVWQDGGFVYAGAGPISDHLPNDYLESLESRLADYPEFREVLGCAACMGMEFSVQELSEGVELSRLKLLNLLHRIEAETSLIHDVLEKDDTFAFQSPYMLEMLRKILHVRADGPATSNAPQIVREYHYRLGRAFQQTSGDSNAALFTVANHFYAAGSRHGKEGMESALKAAKAAGQQFQYGIAREYVKKAEECAKAAGLRGRDVDREKLLINCHVAHLGGIDRIDIADEGRKYLEQYNDATFEVYRAVAQACYDAGLDTRDQKYIEACRQYAETMTERFKAPLQQAVAYHFWGIGLPQNEQAERLQKLEEAMSCLSREREDMSEALRLEARIAHSLADQLSRRDSSSEEQERAKQLYKLSRKLNKDHDDLKGLSFSYGGLGRLAFHDNDIKTAQRRFKQALACTEKVGDLSGQSINYSWLGRCELRRAGNELKLPHIDLALAHYQASFNSSTSLVNQCHALAGLLTCCGRKQDDQNANTWGEKLQSLTGGELEKLSADEQAKNPIHAIPMDCRGPIRRALAECKFADQTAWHKCLSKLIDNQSV